MENLPVYLSQGELARLFPVLSTTSKEGRTTSIVLACLSKVEEFGSSLLATVGQRVGKRAKLECFTEIVFKKVLDSNSKDRPDGLIVLSVGSRSWMALVEAKVGNNDLAVDQIEKYRALAKQNGIDCVISISNDFATDPASHPLEAIRKSRSKVPVFHWSWMHILTTADLLLTQDGIQDQDQRVLLNELRRFLSHESAGVRGFTAMPKEWKNINKLISSGGIVPYRSNDAQMVLGAWHQETRDLSLILSRLTEAHVVEKLPRKHAGNPAQRQKDELIDICENARLTCAFEVPHAAAPIEVCADIMRRCVDVGMKLNAPKEKKTTKARINWVLRQIKTENKQEVHIRLNWPGKSPPTQFQASELLEEPQIASVGKEHLSVTSFFVFHSKRLGARFTQQSNFITDLETVVPGFYDEVGADLVAWKQRPPRIKSEVPVAQEVSPEAISDKSEGFEP